MLALLGAAVFILGSVNLALVWLLQRNARIAHETVIGLTKQNLHERQTLNASNFEAKGFITASQLAARTLPVDAPEGGESHPSAPDRVPVPGPWSEPPIGL